MGVIPGVGEVAGFLGWMARTHVLLYIGVIYDAVLILLGSFKDKEGRALSSW